MSHKAVWELHKVTERLTFDLFSLKCHQFAIYPLKGCQINNDSWGLGKSEVNLTLESWQSYTIISSLGSSECLCQIWIHFHKVFKRFCHLNDTYWRISNNVRWTDNSENLVHAEAEEKTSKTAWIWTAQFNLTAFHSLENSCENQMGLNVQNALAYLDVTSSWDQKRVVWGEVQICYPASMQRVHAILTVPGTNLQQGPILDTPELWCTVTHYKSSNKQMLGPINN